MRTIDDRGIRPMAAEALGSIADTRAVEPLIAALKDREEFVADEAATALGKLGDRRAVEPLIAVVKDRNSPCPRGRGGRVGKSR